MTVDTLLPFVNGHLKQVQAKGGGERYDRPATSGATKWTATVGVDTPVYIFEQQLTTAAAERLDQPTADTMLVDSSLGIGWARDDSVTFDHLVLDTFGNTTGSTSETRRVQNVNQFEVVGLTELIFWQVS